MTDEDEIKFGKHAGTKMKDVPASYLLWLWNNGMWSERRRNDGQKYTDDSMPVRDYIIKNFNHLETECPDIIIEHRP